MVCFGTAAILATLGLVLPLDVTTWFPAALVLVGVIVVGPVLLAQPRLAVAGAPLVGVAIAWFTLVPVLGLLVPPVGRAPIGWDLAAWSWVIAGLLAIGILRTPWAEWSRGSPSTGPDHDQR